MAQVPPVRFTSTMEWPMAALQSATCSAVIFFAPTSSSGIEGNMTLNETLSLLTQSRPLSELADPRGKGM